MIRSFNNFIFRPVQPLNGRQVEYYVENEPELSEQRSFSWSLWRRGFHCHRCRSCWRDVPTSPPWSTVPPLGEPSSTLWGRRHNKHRWMEDNFHLTWSSEIQCGQCQRSRTSWKDRSSLHWSTLFMWWFSCLHCFLLGNSNDRIHGDKFFFVDFSIWALGNELIIPSLYHNIIMRCWIQWYIVCCDRVDKTLISPGPNVLCFTTKAKSSSVILLWDFPILSKQGGALELLSQDIWAAKQTTIWERLQNWFLQAVVHPGSTSAAQQILLIDVVVCLFETRIYLFINPKQTFVGSLSSWIQQKRITFFYGQHCFPYESDSTDYMTTFSPINFVAKKKLVYFLPRLWTLNCSSWTSKSGQDVQRYTRDLFIIHPQL